MITVLILAYDFPPHRSVGGLRPAGWFKFLKNEGIYPIVITRQWGNSDQTELDYVSPGYSDFIVQEETPAGLVIRTPYKPNHSNRLLLKHGDNKFKIYRKLVTACYEILQFALPIGGKYGLYSGASEFLKGTKVDCIIATGDPFILFRYASRLSRKFSTPWIADYRDAWVQDKSVNNPLLKLWFAFNERKCLKTVSVVTTVSTFLQKQIMSNIGERKFEIVYNGYDPEVISKSAGVVQSDDKLSIGFGGTIYEWHPIERFLSVCDSKVRNDPGFEVKLNFYGINKQAEIEQLLEDKFSALSPFVTFYPRMDNLEFAESFSRNNCFLLFNDYSFMGTKIFDYLALRRKIILCFENDEESKRLKSKYFFVDEIQSESNRLQAELIEATKSGYVVRDADALAELLTDLHREISETGKLQCDSVDIEKYSKVKQVGRLAEIIKQVSGNKEG